MPGNVRFNSNADEDRQEVIRGVRPHPDFRPIFTRKRMNIQASGGKLYCHSISRNWEQTVNAQGNCCFIARPVGSMLVCFKSRHLANVPPVV